MCRSNVIRGHLVGRPLWGGCLWLLLGFCLWGAGCSKAPLPDRGRHMRQGLSPREQQALQKLRGRRVLSTFGLAQSRHRRATLLQKMGQLEAARKELDAILALRFPASYRPGEEMLLDTWARKARLLLLMGQSQKALATIDAAIKRPSSLRRSFYVAHLHHVRGGILEKLKRPKEALMAFQRSIDINKETIKEALAAQRRLEQLGGALSRPLPRRRKP